MIVLTVSSGAAAASRDNARRNLRPPMVELSRPVSKIAAPTDNDTRRGEVSLRAAIATAAGSGPDLLIVMGSHVVPMRSQTVATEGASAGVIINKNTLDLHFEGTVSGGSL